MVKPWFNPEAAPRRVAGGYAIPANAVVPGLVVRDAERHLIIGRGATVQGGIDHAGSVTLGPHVKVFGSVRSGRSLTLAPGAKVKGALQCDGRIVIQSRCVVDGDITGEADVLLLGTSRVGHVRSKGDIIIVGSPKARSLSPGGRIVTREW